MEKCLKGQMRKTFIGQFENRSDFFNCASNKHDLKIENLAKLGSFRGVSFGSQPKAKEFCNKELTHGARGSMVAVAL